MNELPIENPYLPANHQDAGKEYFDDSLAEDLVQASNERVKARAKQVDGNFGYMEPKMAIVRETIDSITGEQKIEITRKIDYTELYITLSVFLAVSLAVILLVVLY